MHYQTVVTEKELESFVVQIRETRAMSVYLVATEAEPMTTEIVGVALSVIPGKAIYVPIKHIDGQNMALARVLDVLKSVLEDDGVKKVGQDLLFLTVVLRRVGVRMHGRGFDVMLADYLLDPGRQAYDFCALCKTHLDMVPISVADLIGRGKKQVGFANVAVKDARDFACEWADLTLRLRDILMLEIESQGLDSLLEEVDMPLVDVLADMTFVGMALDVPFLEEMASDLSFELDTVTDAIYELAGAPFNLNSPKELSHILFEKLALPPGRKTKTGYSTDQSVLERLAPLHPLPEKLLAYREFSKLQSTYVEALPRLLHPETGRIHASFNQAVTATGRLSVSNPNLQNIPIRTVLGQQIRKAFVPGKRDWFILSADYSQIELRIMAHLSDDETLAAAFEMGEDVHRHTASMVFDLAPEFVTDEMRGLAKTVNYGVIYGMSAFGLAQQLGLTVGEAQGFINRYFATYPQIRTYIDDTIDWARREGYVETMLGRRRYVPEIVSVNARKREYAERIAVNTPVQGTASDLIKLAMIRIFGRLQNEGLQSKLLLQVHDELVFAVPKDELTIVEALAQKEMVHALILKVPIEVSVGAGGNWLAAH